MKLRALCLLSVLLSALAVDAGAQITTVVKKDDPVGDGILRKFRAPIVSDAAGERIAFRGTVRDLNGSQHGIYRVDSTGAGGPVAERGGIDPCVPPSTTFRNFLQPSINAGGDVAWFGFLGNGSRGLYRTDGGMSSNHRQLVVEGMPVGAVPNAVFLDFDAPELANATTIAFWASILVNGTDVRDGIFTLAGGTGDCLTGLGTVALIAQSGDPVPDNPGFEFCSLHRAIGAGAFNLAFQAEVSTNCAGGGLQAGIFRSDLAGTNIETIALEGTNTEINFTTYRAFGDMPTVENDGVVAFRADTVGAATTEAIFICNPALDCPATTLPEVVVHGTNHDLKRLESPKITNAGDVVFRARSRSIPNGPAIYVWRATPGNLPPEVIVERDDPVPDAGAMALFRSVGSHHVSPGGDVMFRGVVRGTDDGWRTALFLWED